MVKVKIKNKEFEVDEKDAPLLIVLEEIRAELRGIKQKI